MKVHMFDDLEVEQSHTGRWWRYDVSRCGIRRQEDDTNNSKHELVTCSKCLKSLTKEVNNVKGTN